MNNNDLVILNDKNEPTTTSLLVAKVYEKEHSHVVRDIKVYIKGGVTGFGETPYVHPQNNQEYKMYEMTKQAFTILVMGFTGEKATVFRKNYADAFDKMEDSLLDKDETIMVLTDRVDALEKTVKLLAEPMVTTRSLWPMRST